MRLDCAQRGLRRRGVVATNAKRYERGLERDRTEKARMKQVLVLWRCEMCETPI
jgi:hypothetical protein